MAMATATPPKKMLHIDAIQSVMPGKVTPPGRSRRIAAASPPGPGLLQSRFQIVLYYGAQAREGAEESPLTIGAWIKDSLSAALSEHPVMAGRLRRDGESGGDWEVKFNDCGVRLAQATAEAAMSEFLAAEDRDGREAKLAYWADVDEENPNFSALFYIQVTQFQGGGYSIGISCSLLLADPLFLGRFLKFWARTHTNMLAQGQLTRSPIFHLSYFQRPNCPRRLKAIELDSNPINSSSTSSMLFKVARDSGIQSYTALAAACLREATRRLEAKVIVPNYSLIISDQSGDTMVESHSLAQATSDSSDAALGVVGVQEVTWLDELGIEEMTLVEGTKPVRVSCRIVSGVDEGLVAVILPEGVSEYMVSVTVPKII